jgi:hypothetical protein
MNARRPLACVAAVGALLALSACEKPAPIVTVVSGGTSVYKEANTWCFEDQTPPDCAERASGTTSLPVRAGETVGVDVAKELAEGGWYLELSAPAAARSSSPSARSPRGPLLQLHRAQPGRGQLAAARRAGHRRGRGAPRRVPVRARPAE